MRLSCALRRFARATEGLAALEFALIAPMMVLLLFGAVELIDALEANQRTQNAASSMADVISRELQVSDTELSGLWSSLDVLMYPSDGAAVAGCITSISIDNNGVSHTQWHEVHESTAHPFGTCPSSHVQLTSAMKTPNTSLIVAETRLYYSPRLHFIFSGDFQMAHTVYRRSRRIDPIPRVSG